MKYIYCLVKAEADPISLPRGIDSMPIDKISFGAISALVSDIEPGARNEDLRNALAHHEVVKEALQSFSAVIPCRFGMVFKDEASLISMLEEHYGALQAHLEKFQGKVEVGIKAILNGDAEEDEVIADTMSSSRGARACPGHVRIVDDELKADRIPTEMLSPGERYLLEKIAGHRKFERLKERAKKISMALKEATAPYWEEARAENRPLSHGLMLALCFLVGRAELTRFKLQYERFRKEYSGIQFLYTGPWPPYTFASFDLDKGQGITSKD